MVSNPVIKLRFIKIHICFLTFLKLWVVFQFHRLGGGLGIKKRSPIFWLCCLRWMLDCLWYLGSFCPWRFSCCPLCDAQLRFAIVEVTRRVTFHFNKFPIEYKIWWFLRIILELYEVIPKWFEIDIDTWFMHFILDGMNQGNNSINTIQTCPLLLKHFLQLTGRARPRLCGAKRVELGNGGWPRHVRAARAMRGVLMCGWRAILRAHSEWGNYI